MTSQKYSSQNTEYFNVSLDTKVFIEISQSKKSLYFLKFLEQICCGTFKYNFFYIYFKY